MDLDRPRFGIGLALVALTAAMSFTVASASEAQTSRGVTYDQTCGLLPGEGAYGYIRVKNISCGDGKRAAFKALDLTLIGALLVGGRPPSLHAPSR